MDLTRYLEDRRAERMANAQSPENLLRSMDSSLTKLVKIGQEDQQAEPIASGTMGEVTNTRIKAAIQARVEQKLAEDQIYAIAEFASDSKKGMFALSEQLRVMNESLQKSNQQLGLISELLTPKTKVTNSKEDTYRKTDKVPTVLGRDNRSKQIKAATAVGGGGLLGMGLDLLSDMWPSKNKPTVGQPTTQPPKGKAGWFGRLASKLGIGGAGAAEGAGQGLFKSLGGAVKSSALVASLFELPGLYDTLTSEDPKVDKTKEVAKSGGRIAGITAGAAAGGMAGAALGSVVPVIGTTIGGLAGSVVGGLAGSGAGEWIADKGTDAVRYAGGKLNDFGSWLGGKTYDAKEYLSEKASSGYDALKQLPASALSAAVGAMMPALPLAKSVSEVISSAFKVDIVPAFNSAASTFMLSATSIGESMKTFFADFGKKTEEFVQDTKNSASYGLSVAKGYANKVANKVTDSTANLVNKGAQALGMPKVMKSSVEKDILASGTSLGAVSKKHESGGRGVEVISDGVGDHGGVSYGTYQLASNNGSMAAFLKSQEGQKYASQFQGLKAGSQEFNNAYKNVVGSDKAGFEAAQQAYISRTHYAPMAQNLKDNTGLDVSQRGRALQEQVFSTSVQYGANSKVLQKALAGLTPDQLKSMSDEQLTQKITDYKKATVGQYFGKSSANVQANVAKRFDREQNDYKTIIADAKLNNATDRNKSYQDYIASRGGDTADNRKAWLATQTSKDTVPTTAATTTAESKKANATVPTTAATTTAESKKANTAVPTTAVAQKTPASSGVKPTATIAVNPTPAPSVAVANAAPVQVAKSDTPTDIKTVQIANTQDITPSGSDVKNVTPGPSSSTVNGAQPTLATIPMTVDDFGLQLLNLGIL